MLMLIPILIVMLFGLAGCGLRQPTSEELAHADYGPPPQNYQAIVKAGFQNILRDPFSAQYRFNGAPIKGWYRDSLFAGNGLHFGWGGHVEVNAKNGFGGYVGFTDYSYLIKNGTLVALEPTNPGMQ